MCVCPLNLRCLALWPKNNDLSHTNRALFPIFSGEANKCARHLLCIQGTATRCIRILAFMVIRKEDVVGRTSDRNLYVHDTVVVLRSLLANTWLC